MTPPEADDTASSRVAPSAPTRWRFGTRLSKGAGSTLFRAAIAVGGLTMVAKAVSLGKDLLVASKFGRSDAFEAYVNAFVIPLLIVGTFGSAANSALVSTYVGTLVNRGRTQANELLARLNGVTFVAMTGLSLVLLLLARHLLAPFGLGFSQEKVELQYHLFVVMLPILPLAGLASIWSAALNAEGMFARVALSPVVIPLCIIVPISIFGARFHGFALATGTMVGFAVQTLVLGALAVRADIAVLPRWSGWESDVRQVLRLFVPAALAATLMGLTTAIDQAMAAMLPSGSVAAFNYGTKFVSLITALGATAFSASLIPHLSRLVARHEWTEVRRIVRVYVLTVLAFAIPFTVVIYFGSNYLVSTVFQRGTFTAEDARIVSQVQAFLCLQIPAYAVGMVFVSLIVAMRNTAVFVAGNVLNVVCNVAFNWLLMRRFGVAGIALSTSAVYLVSSVFLMSVSYRLLQAEERKPVSDPLTADALGHR